VKSDKISNEALAESLVGFVASACDAISKALDNAKEA
jgi:hypothetical protein